MSHQQQPQPPAPPPSQPPPGGAQQTGTRGGGGRALRIVFGILLVIVLAVVALWAASELTRSTVTDEQQLEAGDIDSLRVDADAALITITVEDRDDISVRSRRTTNLWTDATSGVTASDGTMSVTSRCARRGFLADCRVEHQLAVPTDALTRMTVGSTAGDIAIRGFGGEVEVLTTAGRITLVGFTGETARLRSTAGQIVVDAEAAPRSLEVSTTAGEIGITVPDEPYRVSTGTTAGAVAVDVREDPEAERSISASTTAGRIRIAVR